MRSKALLVDEALGAVERGRVSVEEVVRAALGGRAEFFDWLGRHAQATPKSRPRRWRLRRAPRCARAVMEAALAQARRRLARCGVVAVSWGIKYEKGAPRRPGSLIAWVEEKKDPARKASRVPAWIDVTVKGRRTRFFIDVQEVPTVKRQAGEVRPGKGLHVIVGEKLGTMSALLGNGHALLSGHVVTEGGDEVLIVLDNGSQVSLGNVDFQQVDDRIDAALVGEVPDEAATWISLDPAPVATLEHADHDILVTVRTARGLRESFVDALDVPARFSDGKTMVGLIRLGGRITIDGDSGAPVMDGNGAIVGFVLGVADGHTVLVPARRIVDALP